MAKPVKQEPKKPYSSPIITVYGTVQEITKTVSIHGHKDNGTGNRSKTHA
jgi:hypothetical protein